MTGKMTFDRAQDLKPDLVLEKLKRSLYVTAPEETSAISEAIDEFVRARLQEFKKEIASILFPESQR